MLEPRRPNPPMLKLWRPNLPQLLLKLSSFSNIEQLNSCKMIIIYPGFLKYDGEGFWKLNSDSMLIIIKKLRRIKRAAKVKDVVGVLKDAFSNLIKCLLLSSYHSMPFLGAASFDMSSILFNIICSHSALRTRPQCCSQNQPILELSGAKEGKWKLV